MIIICITIVAAILVWLIIPYSPLKSEFQKGCARLSHSVVLEHSSFSEKLLSTKPELLQNYIRYCGLSGAPMMKAAITVHRNADFLLQDDAPMTKIQYTQANFATICERLAFIDTKMAKLLPFQGLDDNMGGKGKMKGVVAKFITVFNVQGKEMDMAALVTVLAESFICPSFLLHRDIAWEEVDGSHLRATLTQYGITVSGVFEFDSAGAIIRFDTKDRFEEKQGKMTRRDWKVECGDYKKIDGFKRPTAFRASWVYPDSEKLYFDCREVTVRYQYETT